MHQKTKDIQNRYEGFLQTLNLWKNDAIYGLHQFEIAPKSIKIQIVIDEKLRLGKYVERFVSHQLQQEPLIDIIAENIQIQQGKRTLGELDCILQKENTIIHLEVVYKFYLIDETVGTTELEHCIGPNRKDSLVEKLSKLKQKQLPLLYSNECETYLKSIGISRVAIKQLVYFKAQLFTPFSKEKIKFNKLNSSCISGFYINKKELLQFQECKFYIPNKKDWLVIPHSNVYWLSYHQFKEKSDAFLTRNFSPMCWIKTSNGVIHKVFLVWW